MRSCTLTRSARPRSQAHRRHRHSCSREASGWAARCWTWTDRDGSVTCYCCCWCCCSACWACRWWAGSRCTSLECSDRASLLRPSCPSDCRRSPTSISCGSFLALARFANQPRCSSRLATLRQTSTLWAECRRLNRTKNNAKQKWVEISWAILTFLL